MSDLKPLNVADVKGRLGRLDLKSAGEGTRYCFALRPSFEDLCVAVTPNVITLVNPRGRPRK